ncbi:hypothetical protein [Desulfosporosinus lacus]|nr:hypothetical protein [Desulfosporosinus lacus]
MTFSLLKKANLMSEIPAEQFEHSDRDLIKTAEDNLSGSNE